MASGAPASRLAEQSDKVQTGLSSRIAEFEEKVAGASGEAASRLAEQGDRFDAG